MADGILSFPARLTSQGYFATAPYGSDQEIEEALAVLTLTHLGERPMEPDFGIPDPVWGAITLNDVETGLEEYGPEGVVVVDIVENVLDETTSSYEIEWERDAPDNDDV